MENTKLITLYEGDIFTPISCPSSKFKYVCKYNGGTSNTHIIAELIERDKSIPPPFSLYPITNIDIKNHVIGAGYVSMGMNEYICASVDIDVKVIASSVDNKEYLFPDVRTLE